MSLLVPIVTPRVPSQLDIASGQSPLQRAPEEQTSSSLDLFDCGTNEDIFQLSSVSVDPDPPLRQAHEASNDR